MSKRETKRAFLISITAKLEGVTPRSVSRVLNDEQNNENVFETFLCVEEEVEKAIEHVAMIRAVDKLLLFREPENNGK